MKGEEGRERAVITALSPARWLDFTMCCLRKARKSDISMREQLPPISTLCNSSLRYFHLTGPSNISIGLLLPPISPCGDSQLRYLHWLRYLPVKTACSDISTREQLPPIYPYEKNSLRYLHTRTAPSDISIREQLPPTIQPRCRSWKQYTRTQRPYRAIIRSMVHTLLLADASDRTTGSVKFDLPTNTSRIYWGRSVSRTDMGVSR